MACQMTDKPDPLASLRPPIGDGLITVPDGQCTDAFGCDEVALIIIDSNGGLHLCTLGQADRIYDRADVTRCGRKVDGRL